MAFWHTDIRWCDGNFDILKAMKSSPLHGPFCGSEFLRFSLLKILRVCVFWCFKLETIVLSISAELTIISSLKHKNTQPLYIFNRENPQNSEPQNGPWRGLDFIALQIRTWKGENIRKRIRFSPVLFGTQKKIKTLFYLGIDKDVWPRWIGPLNRSHLASRFTTGDMPGLG